MKILALELSSPRGSLAWREDGSTAFAREWRNDRKHSDAFFENLKLARQEFGAPDKIIVGLGPGSYAGIRIAISAAIGLQAASGAELNGYPSICAMESHTDEYCAIGDARRQSFFFARICKNDLVSGPDLLSEAELQTKLTDLDPKIPIFSSDKLPQVARLEMRHPSAELLTRLAQSARHGFASPPLEPIYLREPHITTPARSR